MEKFFHLKENGTTVSTEILITPEILRKLVEGLR